MARAPPPSHGAPPFPKLPETTRTAIGALDHANGGRCAHTLGSLGCCAHIAVWAARMDPYKRSLCEKSNRACADYAYCH
eukprot:15475761-Alexandrium_andersonii.AAC.1